MFDRSCLVSFSLPLTIQKGPTCDSSVWVLWYPVWGWFFGRPKGQPPLFLLLLLLLLLVFLLGGVGRGGGVP